MTADLTWQAFADAIPDLVVRIDASGTIVYASRAAGALGYEPRDLVGRRAAEFVHPEDLASHQTIAAAVFSTTPAPATVRREHRFRRKDGGWVWLRGNPVILPQAEGEPVEVLNILRDVTREVTTAQAGRRKLQEALEQAQQAAVAKSQFLSNMSHEIRTPLTAVIGFAGLLAEREDLDPDAARYVARIGGAGRSLQAIVNDVLDFAKLEAGQMTFQPRPASAIVAAREVLEVHALQAAEKSIELRFEVAAGTPEHVVIDPDRLRQILLGLVGNAVKFTARGAVTLRLGMKPGRSGPRRSTPGQASPRRTARRSSSISPRATAPRRAPRAGRAWAWPSPMAWRSAWAGVSPCAAGSAGGPSSAWSCRPNRPNSPRSPATGDIALDIFLGLRVLVVDDNDNNRELARAILEQFGVEVTEAPNGLEAIALAARAPFDAILMDIRMPGLDGRATLAAIRARAGPNRDMPILAFSADNIGDAPDMIDLDEFQGRVIKPIEPSAMLAAIAQAVDAEPGFQVEDADAAAA